MVFVTGAEAGISNISSRTLLFLVLSGLATGASWLCYFHALQKGDVNKVVSLGKGVGIVLIGVGTMLMITRKGMANQEKSSDGSWFIYAVFSAVFASLTAILGKAGIEGVDSNLGTAIRTTVVLVMAWFMVFVTGEQKKVRTVEKIELLFICLSGLATGASWLCYYRALQEGPASVVVPIDKLSMLITIAFSYIVFHEKLTKKAAFGVVLITAGTILLAMM